MRTVKEAGTAAAAWLCVKQTKTNATTVGESLLMLVYIISLFTFLCAEEDPLQKEGHSGVSTESRFNVKKSYSLQAGKVNLLNVCLLIHVFFW